MPRIAPIDFDLAVGKARQLLGRVHSELGMVPNFHRTLAHSPAGLEAFCSAHASLLEGVVPERLQQLIGLTVAECNQAEYSWWAHAALAKTLGASDEEIRDACRGCSLDRKWDALLHFARDVVEKRGSIQDDSYQRLLRAGCSNQEIVETLCWIGLFTLSDYLSEAVQMECDFPSLAGKSPATTAAHDPSPREGKPPGASVPSSGTVESTANAETTALFHHDPLRDTRLDVQHDPLPES